jgi:hypothetical protein
VEIIVLVVRDDKLDMEDNKVTLSKVTEERECIEKLWECKSG